MRVIVVIGLVMASGLATVGGASAAAGPGAAVSVTVTATRPASRHGSAVVSAEAIACTLNVNQRPHNSGHVPGTVNVVETASCTAAVPRLTVTAYLYPPIPWATVVGRQGVGTRSVSSNAATTYCANGTYQGYGYMTVTFPPGFYPPGGALGRFGPSVPIRCII